jgi:hypothetical protein
MSNRRGASLVELLVVITTGMIVVGLAVTMVRSLVDANRAAESHLVRNGAVRRLCESFRVHVRAARAAESAAEDQALRLKLSFEDGREVEFRSEEQVVVRTERDRGTDRRRESYTLPANSTARFEVQSDDGTTIVRLIINQAPNRPSEAASREFVALATLDHDHRFEAKGN